jgi:Arc/MetJ-type ribon-helix-helix transcriptional regulator
MSATTKPRRRWTDAAIETELRAQCEELGRFPTRAELVARGLRGLWDAMRSAGGLERWRQRFDIEISPASNEEPSAASSEPMVAASMEEIAARAYELYESGAPGDAVAHWLTAEHEITAARLR